MPTTSIRLRAALLITSIGALTVVGGAAPASTHWVATWGTAQPSYRAPAAPAAAPPAAPVAAPAPPAAGRSVPQRRFPVPPPLAGVDGQTVRMIVRTSLGGDTLRVRL